MTDTDNRVRCVDCTRRQRVHTGLMACTQPKRAGLNVAPRATYMDMGRDFAALPQRCFAFSALKCSRCGGAHSVSRCPWPTGGQAARERQ